MNCKSTEISPIHPPYIYHIYQRWQKEVNQHSRRNSTSLRINEEVVEVEVAGEVGEVLEAEEVAEVGDEVVSEVEVDLAGLGMVREVGVVG